jgi:hypothetical protein
MLKAPSASKHGRHKRREVLMFTAIGRVVVVGLAVLTLAAAMGGIAASAGAQTHVKRASADAVRPHA